MENREWNLAYAKSSLRTEQHGASYIYLLIGSVVDMHVDAIVNAANKALIGGAGVDGAIHRAAGPKLDEACRKLHGCETGEAKITPAFNLKTAKAIIHTVGPVYQGKTQDAIDLTNCYRHALLLAQEKGYSSIAFPCISAGVYGYPIAEAARLALTSVREFLTTEAKQPMDVYLVCFKATEYEAYRQQM